MNHWCVRAAGLFAATAMVFASGASRPHEDEKPADEKKPEPARQLRVVAERTAYFNMAAVMRDFQQAKYRVWLLNQKRNELSKDLIAWRAEYIGLQRELQQNPALPQREEKAQQMLQLARKIEDEDKKINKQLNDSASAIITDLHDKIRTVVQKTAEINGVQAVLTYPDGVTPEELNSPHVKELKLKPPALHPWEIDPRAEYTAVIVKTLNVWYPPTDKAGQPVDLSKLDMPPAVIPAQGTLPAPPKP